MPALTQACDAPTYFSACGWLAHSTASTVWSGSSVQVSSELRSFLFGPADQVLATGS